MIATILTITVCLIAIPVGFALARWIDGDAGIVIRRTHELMGQGMTRTQAEEMAETELANSR